MAGKTQESQRTRYLLGGESEVENERIEAEFFADDDLFQEMLTAEDDLIDAYARGELSASQRKEFEQRFLKSSEARERVQFARAFAAASGPQMVAAPVIAPAPPGFFASLFGSTGVARLAFATIAIAVFVGFAWLLFERSRMSQELNALRSERERLNQQAQELQRTAETEKSKNAETLAQLKTLQDQVTASANQNTRPQPIPQRRNTRIDNNETVAVNRRNDPPVQDNVAFDVDPGSTRGGGGNTFTVSRNVKSISLRLGLEAESSRQDYRAMIETADGRRVKSVDFKVANVPHERVAVPAVSTNDLRAGDYVIFLMGKQADGSFERVASYSFRIVNK